MPVSRPVVTEAWRAPAAPSGLRIPYVDLGRQYDEEKADIHACVERVFRSGTFIGGALVEAFEEHVAAYVGTKFAVALNSGTDALTLGMTALGIGAGDEVITPPNSFVASTGSVVLAGAKPVFADVKADQNIDPAAVEAAITPRTRAIVAVHLTGRACDMSALGAIARRHGLALIEDAAQAFGTRYHGRLAGALGTLGCFSAHPLKNLNAAGDAGFVTTDDKTLVDKLHRMRNHGLADRNTVVHWGTVSRMAALDGALLSMRLTRLPSVIERRRRNAARYRKAIHAADVFMPPCRAEEFNTFHTFVIQCDRRDALQAHLARCGVGTAIHYPIPIHLQPAAASLGYRKGDFPTAERQAERILSLPVHQFMESAEIDYVAAEVNRFFG